jgi:hypothetical protein
MGGHGRTLHLWGVYRRLILIGSMLWAAFIVHTLWKEFKVPSSPSRGFVLADGRFRDCDAWGLYSGRFEKGTSLDVNGAVVRRRANDDVDDPRGAGLAPRTREEAIAQCAAAGGRLPVSLIDVPLGGPHRLLIDASATKAQRSTAEILARHYVDEARTRFLKDLLGAPLGALAAALLLPLLLLFGVPYIGPRLFRGARRIAIGFTGWMLYGAAASPCGRDKP